MNKICYWGLIVLFCSCSDNGFLSSGADDMVVYTDTLNYQCLHISSTADLMLIQDTVNFIRVEGAESDIDNLSTTSTGDTLNIVINTRFRLAGHRSRSKIYAHFINLRQLITTAPANITNQDTLRLQSLLYYAIGEIGEADIQIVCNHLEMHNSANTLGWFYFSGRAVSCRFYNRYGCSIFAGGLKVQQAEIFNESVGDVYINASEELNVYLWGPGNIYYCGIPEVHVIDSRSTGKVVPADCGF